MRVNGVMDHFWQEKIDEWNYNLDYRNHFIVMKTISRINISKFSKMKFGNNTNTFILYTRKSWNLEM